MTKPAVIAQDWFIYQHGENKVLCGICFNHPRVIDGHHFFSSSIQSMKEDEVETHNTMYQLVGKPLAEITQYWVRRMGLVQEGIVHVR